MMNIGHVGAYDGAGTVIRAYNFRIGLWLTCSLVGAWPAAAQQALAPEAAAEAGAQPEFTLPEVVIKTPKSKPAGQSTSSSGEIEESASQAAIIQRITVGRWTVTKQRLSRARTVNRRHCSIPWPCLECRTQCSRSRQRWPLGYLKPNRRTGHDSRRRDGGSDPAIRREYT